MKGNESLLFLRFFQKDQLVYILLHYGVKMSYVDKLVTLKSLILSLFNYSLEVLIDQNRFLPDILYTFGSTLLHYF